MFQYNSNIYFMVNFDVICVHFASFDISSCSFARPLANEWLPPDFFLNGFTSVTVQSHEKRKWIPCLQPIYFVPFNSFSVQSLPSQ